MAQGLHRGEFTSSRIMYYIIAISIPSMVVTVFLRIAFVFTFLHPRKERDVNLAERLSFSGIFLRLFYRVSASLCLPLSSKRSSKRPPSSVERISSSGILVSDDQVPIWYLVVFFAKAFQTTSYLKLVLPVPTPSQSRRVGATIYSKICSAPKAG